MVLAATSPAPPTTEPVMETKFGKDVNCFLKAYSEFTGPPPHAPRRHHARRTIATKRSAEHASSSLIGSFTCTSPALQFMVPKLQMAIRVATTRRELLVLSGSSPARIVWRDLGSTCPRRICRR